MRLLFALMLLVALPVFAQQKIVGRPADGVEVGDDVPFGKVFGRGERLPPMLVDVPNIPELPAICADLSATPKPLPNGDMQYPQVPCTMAPYDQALPSDADDVPVPDEPARPAAQAPLQPAMTGEPVQAPQRPLGNDLNVQQMRRLGELDAMQGRPINMGNAGNLGYLQGYTAAQQRKAQGGMGNFGGFGR